MAGGATTAAAGETLKCNKWVLKVPIHCDGCKREIKKLLHSIDGVYTTSIDPQEQQVTVTGSIDSEILVKKLLKTGKHAEICAEKSAEKGNKNGKPSDPKPCQNKEHTTATVDIQKKTNKPAEMKAPTAKNTYGKNLDKKCSDGPGVPEAGSAGDKMKKGKGEKGNSLGDGNGAPTSTRSLSTDQGRCKGDGTKVTLSSTFEQLGFIMPNGGPPTVQVLSYNTAYPTKLGHGLSYPVPSASAYIAQNSSNGETESYQVEATGFNSFDIFSDENPNGCTIM